MAKLNPLSALKEVAAQMMGVRRNLQSDLFATRKKIASLEQEYETIHRSPLSRSDALEATLMNIDNGHKIISQRMQGRILTTAERTVKKEKYGNGLVIDFLCSAAQGRYSESMFGRISAFEDFKPHEVALLYNHEELKRSIRSAFDSISDNEWPDHSYLLGGDALKRLAEIESQLVELRQHESDLVTAADKEGVDIGQGSSY